MIKLLYITLNDLRVTFAERAILLNLVVIPVALILAVGAAQGGFGGGSDTEGVVRFDVIAPAMTPQLDAFIMSLRASTPDLRVCPYDGDEVCALDSNETFEQTLVEARLLAGVSQGGVIVPDDFGEGLLSGEVSAWVYLTTGDPLQPSVLMERVEAILHRMGGASVASQVGVMVYEEAGFVFADAEDEGAFRQAIYDEAREQWEALPSMVAWVQAGATDASDEAISFSGGFQQSVPGMGSMYVMFTVLAGVSTLLLERKHWTLQRMMMMPVSHAQFLGGKLFARFVMGMIQFGVAFVTGAVLGVDFGQDGLALLLIMVSFVMCIACLTFFLATLVNSDQQAGVTVTFIALTLAPLGGAWWPLEIVPAFMQTIAYATPVGWAMDGFTQIMVYGGGLGDVTLHVGVLLMASLVIFGLAVRRFGYE